MIDLSLVGLALIGVAAVVIVGSLLFGYYCAVKQTIKVASVTAADEPLFDREPSPGETMALSADQIEEVDDWSEYDSE